MPTEDRELDARVAVEIFNLPVKWDMRLSIAQPYVDKGDGGYLVEHYSSSMASAWPVWETLPAGTTLLKRGDGMAQVKIGTPAGTEWIFDFETAQAICRAALQWKTFNKVPGET